MAAIIHEWSARPIVILTSEFWTWKTEWNIENEQTFS